MDYVPNIHLSVIDDLILTVSWALAIIIILRYSEE